ncbi:hypothetical protein BDU57DRAFT_571441, partial [Ampelomyces quisqualis]
LFKPKAVIYTSRPTQTPESADIKKRKDDEQIKLRRFNAPIGTHQKHTKSNMREFVTPGFSYEKQVIVNHIYRVCAGCDAVREKAVDVKDEVIIGAGFKIDQPAEYRYVIALRGSREDAVLVSRRV